MIMNDRNMNDNDMAKRDITTVIFDLGNVLIDFCWQKAFHKMGIEGERFEKLANATVRDQIWNEHDKGAMSEEEILNGMIANDPSMEAEIRMLYDNLGECLDPYDFSIDWVEDLKAAGYKVYILSNFSRKSFYESGDKLDVVKHADGAVLSFKEQLLKPFPEIYELLIARYNIDRAHAVFLDDTPANIEGARAVGLRGIVVKDHESAIEGLHQLGVYW